MKIERPPYRIKQGYLSMNVPIAASATEPGEVVVDISTVPFHIFAFTLSVLGAIPVFVYKPVQGIPLIGSAGFDPVSTLKFDGIPDLRWRRWDTLQVFNFDLITEAVLFIRYDYLEFNQEKSK